MKKQIKKRTLVTLIVILSLVYLIIAVRPLTTELHMTPLWTSNIQITEKVSVSENIIPYKLGQNMGYFDESGKIYSRVTFPFNCTISKDYYSTYSPDNTVTTVYRPDGKELTKIERPGFPHFVDEKLYILLPGGTSFAQYSTEGKELWSFENYCPVTAFYSNKSGTAAGYADGTIYCFDTEGNITQVFEPSGSEYNIILGLGLSDNGQMIASLSGHNKQRITVAQKSDNHSKIIFHNFLDSETNKQQLVKFNREQTKVYFSCKSGIGVVDLDKKKNTFVEIEGNVTQIEFSDFENLVFVLSKNGNQFTVTVIENPDKKAAQFSFEAKYAFIQVKDENLFIGQDNKISALKISRK